MIERHCFTTAFLFFLEQDFLLEWHFPIAAKIFDLKKQNTNEQNSLLHTHQTK